MASYKLNEAADQDLDNILDYGIDRFGLDKAIAYYDALQSRFDEIADNPLQYPAVDHIRQGYRRSICGVHSIYYRMDNNITEIMRLINRENIERQLSEEAER